MKVKVLVGDDTLDIRKHASQYLTQKKSTPWNIEFDIDCFDNDKGAFKSLEIEKEKLVRLVWSGKSMSKEPSEYLTPFFDDLLAAIQKSNLNLEFDFSHLDFINSSTIQPFINFLDKAQKNGIVLKIIYSIEKDWQELIFAAMRFFETQNSQITIQGI